MSTNVSGHEVARHFGSMGRARHELEQWMKEREHIAGRVLAHVSSSVHNVRSAEIRNLASSHPLGNIHPPEGYRIGSIKDWKPGFAFAHLFHFCLEDLGRIYSFDEFRAWCRDERRIDWLWGPSYKIVNSRRTPEERHAAATSMKWRIGLAYYAFLREIYTVASLRERGIPALSHPLADALFRVDTWCGDIVVEVFIRNREFKSDTIGRKYAAEYYLGDQHRFTFERLQIERQREYGRVHLPGNHEIEACVERIETALKTPKGTAR